MQFTTSQIASLLGGKVEGDPDAVINNIAKIQDGASGCISFLSNLKYENYIYTTRSSAVIVDKTFSPKNQLTTTLIWVDNAYTAFTLLLEQYQALMVFSKVGVEQPSYIADSATVGDGIYRGAFSYVGEGVKIADNVKIHPQVFIGDNVTIGANSVIYAGAKICKNTVIGSGCTIQPNAVIGSDGFGFAPQPDGTYKSIPQMGNVILEDNVDIGANSVVDCATMGSTIIKKGVKLDNLIQVGHNVIVGTNTVIAALTGIAGSTEIGDSCIIAGQVGIAGHLKIAAKTTIGAQGGVGSSIKKEGQILIGTPVIDINIWRRANVIFKHLPDIQRTVNQLEKTLIDK